MLQFERWHSFFRLMDLREQQRKVPLKRLSIKKGLVCQPGMAPMDPVGPIIEKLDSLEGDWMLVGHLPFLSILASQLILGREEPDVVIFPAATLVCVERGPGGRWAVSWLVTPDLL